MSDPPEKILTTCGREVGPEEFEHIREVIRLCTGLTRNELALTFCEHWGWVSATGAFQLRACVKLLEKLEQQGAIRLPVKTKSGRHPGPTKRRSVVLTTRTAPRDPIGCTLAELRPVSLECAH